MRHSQHGLRINISGEYILARSAEYILCGHTRAKNLGTLRALIITCDFAIVQNYFLGVYPNTGAIVFNYRNLAHHSFSLWGAKNYIIGSDSLSIGVYTY